MTYKLYKTSTGENAVMRFNEDGGITSFLFDPANTDYQQYLKWLEEGNTPLPADESE
jgi:hypothetical protein